MITRRKVLIFGVFLTFQSCFALFEDQVGKFDWKQSYVGKVRYSKVDLDPKVSRVYVATEENIVASLSFKDGKVIWRRLLEKSEKGDIKGFYFLNNEIVTISGSRPYMIRGWNKTTGLQTFEWSTNGLPINEEFVWTADQHKVYCLQIAKNSIQVNTYILKNGHKTGSPKLITAPWISSSSKCSVSNGVVTCVSDKNDLTFFNLSDSSTFSNPVVDFQVEKVEPLENGCILVTNDNRKYAALLTINGALKIKELPYGSTVSIGKKGQLQYLTIVQSTSGKNNVLTVEIEAKQESTWTTNSLLSTPEYSSSSCTTENNKLSCYTLVTSEDHSATLLRQGTVLWVREEALARINNVEMIDLPVSDEEAAIEKEFANKGALDWGLTSGVFGMVSRRLSSQILQIKNVLITVLGLKEENRSGERKDLVRDPFGLHKLILVITDAMKIYGINNEKGEIIWQFYLRDFKPLNHFGKETVPLFIQRTSRHLPYPSIATILVQNKDSGLPWLYTFDPITGQSKEKFELKNRVTQWLLLPEANEEFVEGILLLFENNEIEIYPKNTKKIALKHAPSMFIYSVNEYQLTGRTFSSDKSKNLISYPVWTIRVKEGDTIVAVAPKRSGEIVHSQGRVLGDRSVLYKYINPNLVAFATYSPDAVHKSVISIHLVDTVSGAFVYSASHKRALLPVHIVHSENWVVYSYFNDKSKRTELVTLDLYEGKMQRNTTAFSSLDPPLDPFVGKQAYIFPHQITTMKETITEKGITSKHILVGLESGGVMEVPWSFLDPRRGVTPTAEMREEGVLPYIPELALPPEALVTYNHTLIQIKGIHTSPAGLESTSLVFIYGLDLFYTRVSPSKTFDVLKEDFEYWLITAVLTGLITAAYVTKRLASRKALKQAWK